MTAKYTREMYELFPELKRYMNQSYVQIYEAHLKRVGKSESKRIRNVQFTLETGFACVEDARKRMGRVISEEYVDYFAKVFSSDSKYNERGKQFSQNVVDNLSEMFVDDVANGGWDHYDKIAGPYLQFIKNQSESRRLAKEEKKKQKRLEKTGTATLPLDQELPENFVEIFPQQKLGVAEMIMIDGVVYRLEKV